MNIYCETNFILEVVFSQEQVAFCEKILSFCKKKKARLILPAYSFAESIYRIENQAKISENFQKELNLQITQFSRVSKYVQQTQSFRELDAFLNENAKEVRLRFEKVQKDLIKFSELLSFDELNLKNVSKISSKYALSQQDAIIFSSILSHLQQNKTTPICFLNRNAKDFNTPEVKSKLASLNCRLIPSFEHGFSFISSQLQ